MKYIGQCDVKYIHSNSVNNKVRLEGFDVHSSPTIRYIGLAAIQVIMSVLTFVTARILYLYA